MCLTNLLLRSCDTLSLSDAVKLEKIIESNSGIGYKAFDYTGYAFHTYITEWNMNKWKKSSTRKLLTRNREEYFSGFHLFHNLSSAVVYGNRLFGRFIIGVFEYSEVRAVGYDSIRCNPMLTVVAHKARMLHVLANL